MSHYPSTQELAVFRRSLDPAMRHTESGPVGAYPHELRGGIGYRLGHLGNRIFSAYEPGPAAIREASSLRSRAYARMDYCACQHPDRHYGNLPCRVTPESSGVPLGPNGYCWSCWSAKHDQPIPTDTWTEDEPRHPLPIRYQPAFTIG